MRQFSFHVVRQSRKSYKYRRYSDWRKISTSATHTITGVFASSTWTNASTITFSYSSAGFALGDDTGIGCAITSGGGTCTAASVRSTDVVTDYVYDGRGMLGIFNAYQRYGYESRPTGSKQIFYSRRCRLYRRVRYTDR